MRIKKTRISSCFIVFLVAAAGSVMAESAIRTEANRNINLSPPVLSGKLSLEESLKKRRSVREYSSAPLKFEEVSQLLWAAQGITSRDGRRTVPSAGALYPLEIYLLAGLVEGLSPGIYRYSPERHDLRLVTGGDLRKDLARAALGQECITEGTAAIIIAAIYERTTFKYRDRGVRYVHMEAGHVAQNIYLQAESLHLGTVMVGAFYDGEVKEVLKIREEPLCIMPVGRLIEGK